MLPVSAARWAWCSSGRASAPRSCGVRAGARRAAAGDLAAARAARPVAYADARELAVSGLASLDHSCRLQHAATQHPPPVPAAFRSSEVFSESIATCISCIRRASSRQVLQAVVRPHLAPAPRPGWAAQAQHVPGAWPHEALHRACPCSRPSPARPGRAGGVLHSPKKRPSQPAIDQGGDRPRGRPSRRRRARRCAAICSSSTPPLSTIVQLREVALQPVHELVAQRRHFAVFLRADSPCSQALRACTMKTLAAGARPRVPTKSRTKP